MDHYDIANVTWWSSYLYTICGSWYCYYISLHSVCTIQCIISLLDAQVTQCTIATEDKSAENMQSVQPPDSWSKLNKIHMMALPANLLKFTMFSFSHLFWHLKFMFTSPYVGGGGVIIWTSLIARFMGPIWDPSGANRTQMGPILAPWILLSGMLYFNHIYILWFHHRRPQIILLWPAPSDWHFLLLFNYSTSLGQHHEILHYVLKPVPLLWSGQNYTTINYRNWYRDWGQSGVTRDSSSSPHCEAETRVRVRFPSHGWCHFGRK